MSSGELERRLRDGNPIVLDGPTGSELDRRGVDTSLPLWSARALLDAPDVVRQIHLDYLDAGAQLVTANTFRTNLRTLTRAGLGDRFDEMVTKAVDLAKSAVAQAGRLAWTLGSLAPVEDCFRPDLVPPDAELRNEHRAHAERLATAGVDGILVETMNTAREARIAAEEAARTGVPVLVSFRCASDGRLLSGEGLSQAVAALRPVGPQALMINCQDAPTTTQALGLLARESWIPFGCYANMGAPDPTVGWKAGTDLPPATYAGFAKQWLGMGARIVGSCCGTGPEHIRELARVVTQRAHNP